jgi:hypothetical protein
MPPDRGFSDEESLDSPELRRHPAHKLVYAMNLHVHKVASGNRKVTQISQNIPIIKELFILTKNYPSMFWEGQPAFWPGNA